FRSVYRKVWKFESSSGHQSSDPGPTQVVPGFLLFGDPLPRQCAFWPLELHLQRPAGAKTDCEMPLHHIKLSLYPP
ncbi:MAG: hypothetical protein ACOH2L_13180, partial [Devosia sp.]